jgi:arginase
MHTQIIQVPYDSGYKDYRMGRGPGHIVRRLKAEKNFPVDALGADGVEVQDRFALEVGTSFAVARELAEKVRDATGRGDFPLVLAGNCISCIGTLAGLGDPPPAIIWLDAHAGAIHLPSGDQTGYWFETGPKVRRVAQHLPRRLGE